MSYGLQLSASGVAAAMYRQDVLANNLANLDTVGYKPDMAFTMPRAAVRQEDGVMNLPSNQLLERLGGGVLMNPNMVNLAPAALRTTNNQLDVALDGPGFIQVETPAGVRSSETALTRDGRMVLNAKGELVMASSGLRILDANKRPITLKPKQAVTISTDGKVQQQGQTVAELGVMNVSDPKLVRKHGDGVFTVASSTVHAQPATERKVRQFAVEQSGVNEIRTLMDLTSAAREVDAHVSLMQAHDRMMDRAINGLGRVT